MIPLFFCGLMIKKSETGIGTGLDWTGLASENHICGGFSSICYAMACYVNYQSWYWMRSDCIGIALDWMRYDTIRHDTTQYMYVCINIYE